MIPAQMATHTKPPFLLETSSYADITEVKWTEKELSDVRSADKSGQKS